jgi:hypothetical protein
VTTMYDLPELRPFRTIAHRIRLAGGAVVTENGRLESDDFVPGVSGWQINGSGDSEFNNVIVRGDIGDGTVEGELVVQGGLESDNFVAGSAGWRIDGGGDAEFNEGTIRTDLIVGNPVGRRIEILSDNGSGQPAILFYPDAGLTLPIQLSMFPGSGQFRLESSDGYGSLLIDDGEVYISSGNGGGDPGLLDLFGVDVNVGGSTFLVTSDIARLEPATDLQLASGTIEWGDGTTGVPVNTVDGFTSFHLATRTVTVRGAPAGNDDANDAAFASWGPATTVDIPDWATSAHIQTNICGVYGITGVCGIILRTLLDGQTSGLQTSVSGDNLSVRHNYSYCETITGFSTGAGKALIVQDQRSSGAGAIRADTNSDFCYFVTFTA